MLNFDLTPESKRTENIQQQRESLEINGWERIFSDRFKPTIFDSWESTEKHPIEIYKPKEGAVRIFHRHPSDGNPLFILTPYAGLITAPTSFGLTRFIAGNIIGISKIED
ncbi:MAG: hypothetical protein PHP08_04560 [Candidatus Dojkabacteria bacterium]|nr:hypothetical protein [Candidatus Dojkabacteria bacterium]